jgi:uncharacterized protein YndB with AHSA1/START domain
MSEARRGVVTTRADGGRRLEFHRTWPDPIEEVWAALTESERTVRWIGRYDGERGTGATGAFTMTQEAEPGEQPVTIVECEPPTRLVLEWSTPENWRIEVDLWTEDGRTVLRMRQDFAPGAEVGDIAAGWHWYLDKLDAEVGGRPQPGDWDAFLAEVGPGYGLPPS